MWKNQKHTHKYCWSIQYAPIAQDQQQLLDANGKHKIQSVVGTFLYYGCAVEPTVLTALINMTTMQSKPTITTLKQSNMLTDYLATYPNAKLWLYVGNMQWHLESDAAYLVLSDTKSWIAGYFYSHAPPHPSKYHPKGYTVPIHAECFTLKNIVSLAAEAECGGIFHNCSTAIGSRNTLSGISHTQGPTEIITDISTANSFVHLEMCIKHSKSWDLEYNLLRDCLAKNNFMSNGIKESTILQIILPSIIYHPIIKYISIYIRIRSMIGSFI